MFAYYAIKGCDPLVSGQITDVNQVGQFLSWRTSFDFTLNIQSCLIVYANIFLAFVAFGDGNPPLSWNSRTIHSRGLLQFLEVETSKWF